MRRVRGFDSAPPVSAASQLLLVFLGRLRVSHETDGAGGGGHVSLEVAPVLVTRGRPGYAAELDTGSKGSSGGRAPLLSYSGVWSPPASPPAPQAPA